MTATIYILLPVHNRREVTRRFIKCLKAQTYRDYHLILIDDGSTDGTEEIVRGEIEALTVIKGVGDWWWAGSLQQGYKWLKRHDVPTSDLVLIVNDDTEFDIDFLERASNLLSEKSNTLLLAQCYSRQTRQLLDAGVHVDWRQLTFKSVSNPEKINCLSTRGLFLRVSDFFRIGGFYPVLLPHYASDYEFTIRAMRKGMKLVTDNSLKLFLDEGTTGFHYFSEFTGIEFIKKLFSKKSTGNPVYWTIFIALACPWKFKMLNWLRIWKNSIKKILKHYMVAAQ